jgi:hypothetical protein
MGLSGTVSHMTVWRCDRCTKYEIVCGTKNTVDLNPINRYSRIWIDKPEDWMVLASDGSVLCDDCWNETYFLPTT